MQLLWPKGLLSLGAILGGGKNQDVPGVLVAKVVHSAHTAQILPEARRASFFYPSPPVPVFAPPHQTNRPQERRGDVAATDFVPFYWGPPRRQGLCGQSAHFWTF